MKIEKIIVDELTEIDRKYCQYQNLHMFFYNEKDEKAQAIYDSIVRVYKGLLNKIKYGD